MALLEPLPVEPIRVVIVDGDDRVRESLAGILATNARIAVIATAADPAAALDVVRRLRPSVIVLDPRLPDIDGAVAFMHAARALVPGICILAMSWSDPMERAALAAGADGFVRKTYRSSELVAALVAAAEACERP